MKARLNTSSEQLFKPYEVTFVVETEEDHRAFNRLLNRYIEAMNKPVEVKVSTDADKELELLAHTIKSKILSLKGEISEETIEPKG